MKVLIFGQGKSGSTALFTAVGEALSIDHRYLEPPNLHTTDLAPDAVVKMLVEFADQGDLGTFDMFDRRVFLVRDPRDALVSRVLYSVFDRDEFLRDEVVARYRSLLTRKQVHPNSITFSEIIAWLDRTCGVDLIEQVIALNSKTLEIFAAVAPQFQLVKYEDFVQSRCDQLSTYIGAPISPDVLVSKGVARVARTKSFGDWRNWFTPTDSERFERLFGSFMRAFDYRTGTVNARPVIPAKTGTDYVVHVVNDRRRIEGLPPYGA